MFLMCELLVCRESGTETTSAAVEAATAVSLLFRLSVSVQTQWRNSRLRIDGVPGNRQTVRVHTRDEIILGIPWVPWVPWEWELLWLVYWEWEWEWEWLDGNGWVAA